MSITPTAGSMQVHQAWSHVMGDVQGIAKRDKNEQQRFLFRGIDAVMNAVGPALRAHGVVVMPVNVDVQTRDTKTTSGKDTRECQVVVTYRVIGPAGDWFEGMAPGEALDFSDKATAKAMSVAYRTFLLQALTIPTDEPDPDATTYERGHATAHTEPAPGPEPMTVKTRGRLFALFGERGITDETVQRAGMSQILGREVTTRSDLTEAEARQVIARLEAHK